MREAQEKLFKAKKVSSLISIKLEKLYMNRNTQLSLIMHACYATLG